MYNCQQSLIAHLETQFEKPGGVWTIDAYAGQVNTKAQQVSVKLPAVLIMLIEGEPLRQNKEHVFELIVITESRSLQKETARIANLQLIAEIAGYLRENYLFDPVSGTGQYEIDRESAKVRQIYTGDRLCLIGLQITINDHT